MAILSVAQLPEGHFSGFVVDDLWLCTSADIGQPLWRSVTVAYDLRLHLLVHQLLGLFINGIFAICIKLDGIT
jgi:hypothetical protein